LIKNSFPPHGASTPRGPGTSHYRGFTMTHNDASLSVGLLWTSDQPVAETFTDNTKHSQQTHIHARWDSNPQYQQLSGRRHSP
jgi:hypothetical protein